MWEFALIFYVVQISTSHAHTLYCDEACAVVNRHRAEIPQTSTDTQSSIQQQQVSQCVLSLHK